MKCELCNQTSPTSCDHPKNGYCLLYLQQAEKDGKSFGPKHYKTLAELQPRDMFRYKGSDEDDWHTVINLDDEKLYYQGYLVDKPQSNYRTENVEVIVK